MSVVFSQPNGDERAEVLLNMMNQQVKASIKYSNLVFNFLSIKNCFTKSLVVRELLLKSGQNADIQIGVKKENGELISHCWIKSGSTFTEKKSVRNKFKLLDMG